MTEDGARSVPRTVFDARRSRLYFSTSIGEISSIVLLPIVSISGRERNSSCTHVRLLVEYLESPVKLKTILLDDQAREREIRLIILDLLWEEDREQGALKLGVEAMQELSEISPDIPIVIHSVLDDDDTLHNLIPEMIRLGAYDWVGKAEPKNLRSFRFERAYNVGRDVLSRPASRAILPPDQRQRSEVHIAIMFVDMSGFTALTREIGSGSVVEILRSFYRTVGEPIVANEGYIDKYIGDAVMAVFGASSKSDSLDDFLDRVMLNLYELVRMKTGSHSQTARQLRIDRVSLYQRLARARRRLCLATVNEAVASCL